MKDFTNPLGNTCQKQTLLNSILAPIDADVEVDVLRVETAGRTAKELFIQESFISKKKQFMDCFKIWSSRRWTTVTRKSSLNLHMEKWILISLI